jgi:predicted dehydrogenase
MAKQKKILKVGFIGAGGIAGTHMKYLSSMPDVALVAATDVVPANLKAAEENYGISSHYSDWKKMLKSEQLDAVSVCTPNGLHKQPTIDALAAGCHVIVEKPLAMNATEGEAMIEAAKKHKKHLIIGFQWRYSDKAQMLKQAVDAGQFGNIMFMKCQALRRRGIPNWGVFGRKDLQGGGPLIDIGVHIMEMGHYIMGSPKPVAVTGNIWTYMGDKPSQAASMWPNWDHESYTVEDLAIGHVRFENGAIMQVESSFAAHCEDKWDLTFMGEKGGANYDSGPTIYSDRHGHMTSSKPDFLPNIDAFEVKMRSFVDTALYNKPNISDAADGLVIQKIIDGIYKSAKDGKEVSV